MILFNDILTYNFNNLKKYFSKNFINQQSYF